MRTPPRRERARSWRWVVAALSPLLALLLVASAIAQGALDVPAARRPDLSVDEVTVGQRGHAVTAGPANRLEHFPVEVVAILWDAGPGFPLVLVRAGGPFIEATGGIAAGMSGSPVYLDTDGGQALLGAIGYVFPNADHDLALVTPIAAMRSAAPTASAPAYDTQAQRPPFVPGLGRAEPVATPILMSGTSERAAAMLRPLFRGAAVTPFPAQGGGMPAGREPAYVPEPGGAIAVNLVRGDVAVSAVGTITTLDEGQLLAFGHPFLGYGTVTLPLAPAYVSAIVASSQVPFKLANVGSRLLGVVTQDRPGALAGTLDATPELIAVTLNVSGVGGSATYRFEVTPDERLYPVLVAVATLELLDRHVQRTGAGFAELAWEIAFRDGTHANVLEQVSHQDDITWAAAVLAGGPLDVLATNVFRNADVTRVALNVRLDDRPSVATIEDVVAESNEVEAGTSVVAHVRLQPYRESAAVRTVTVPLPAERTGELTLSFRGGRVPREETEPDDDERDIGEPRSFGELLDALRQRLQASELVVELLDPAGGAERLLRVPFPYVIEGSQVLTVTVTDPDAPGESLEAQSRSSDGDDARTTRDGDADGTPDTSTGGASSEGGSDAAD
ncbi:MAG: hypothetical protein R6W77_05615 [Trueperaceae bacterium]